MYDLKEINTARQIAAETGKYVSEDNEQAFLIQWCKREAPQEARRLFAVPNGGSRSKSQGALLKLTGVQPGVPDLFLPVPRYPYHGLWIEMKSTDPKAGPSGAQKDWLAYLAAQGYKTALCRGFEAARDEILNYLNPPVQFSPEIV